MISISTKLPQQDTIKRLERLIRVSSQTHRFSGEISGSSFRLMCSQTVGNGNLRPQFVGTVESNATGSEVKGDFQFAPAARRILGRWFIFGTLWTLGATASVLVHPDPPVLKILPIGG